MTNNPPLHPPPPPSLSSAAITATAKGCFNCNSDDAWILHNLKVQLGCRKICTSCVLKLHPTSFCPTCFNLHDPNSLNPPSISCSSSSSSSNHRTLTCLKCNSVSHITCVPPNTPKSPYLCPPCSNPSFKFFDFKKPRSGSHHDGDGSRSGEGEKGEKEKERQFLDERAARVLLLAAKISVISMNKAATQARTEVERRVRESALARKRAKEAIDHVVSVSSKLISVKQRRDVVSGGPGSSSGTVKVEKNGGSHNVGVPGGDNGALAVVPTPLAVLPVAKSNGGNNEERNVV